MKHAKSGRALSLLALMLAVVMMLTLVGCGDKADDSGKTDGTTAAVTTTATTATTAGDTDSTTTTADATDGTTTDTQAGETETTAGTTGTTAADPFGDSTASSSTKKPATTTTTTNTIPTGVGTVFERVPAKLSGQKIKMMLWWDAAAHDRAEADLFYEKTGIQVTFEASTIDKYQSTLSGKIMAGTPPQCAAILSEWYPQPITRGLMQPIKNTGWDYTNKEDDIYSLGMMQQFAYKGEMYGVALKGSNAPTYEVMFFNKEVLESFGVKEDPYELWKKGQWNWDTCLEIARACTDAKSERYGIVCLSQFYWMLSAGQDFVLSDGNGLVNNIKSSKLLESWTHAWDMIYTYKVMPTNFTQQMELFYAGIVAMFGTGSYFMQDDTSSTQYVPQNVKFDYGVVPFPSPAGMSAVAASEGIVWGFPVKTSGDKLQAAMWWLRYHMDDSKYGERYFYPKEECWEIMSWMSAQKVQSYNSVGVIGYGGKHNAYSIQYSVIDMATTRAAIKTNLDSWYTEIDTNIDAILSEL